MKTKLLMIVMMCAALVGCEDEKAKRIAELEAEVLNLSSELASAKAKAEEEKKRGDEWIAQAEDLAKEVVKYRQAVGDQKVAYESLIKTREEIAHSRGEREGYDQGLNRREVLEDVPPQ